MFPKNVIIVVLGFKETYRVHCEAGSVPVQGGAQLLQLVVNTIALSKMKHTDICNYVNFMFTALNFLSGTIDSTYSFFHFQTS